MQTISSILKIERGQGTWVDDVGSSTYTPSFPLGVLVTLAIDLRAPLADDAELPSLPAYPKSELEGLSLLFVMDLDYDQETIPPFVRTTGITLSEDAAGHLICSIPLPDTNTEAMRNALSTAETQTFRCEIIGRNSSGFDVFAVPFSMTVRNRVLLGDATETPDTSAADWIPTVDAMLQEIVDQKAESLKGASGADGSDGQSAYDLWIAQGNSGTEAEFLASLKGATGDKGEKGDTGDTGSLTMGTVTTLESGEEAIATITDGVLSLGIPTGPRGTDGFALCYAFSPVSDADSDQWHQSVQEEDIYWRISEDNGATWSAARRLEQAAVAPIARFSAVAQTTDSVWVTPTQESEYVQLPAGAAYFRIQCKGYPWTEPRLISAISGTDGMTAEEIAAAEATLKAASIRAQFSADGTEWHAAITSGDLYVRFFSTTGTVLAKWSLVSYGVEHSIQDLQVSEAGAPWHDTPQDGDRYMKISLDGGATWYAKCFQIQGEKGEKGDPGDGYTLPTASASTLGGVKVGTGLSVSSDGVLSSTSTGEAYTLPTASASTLGGVKVGTGLSVSEDGVLSSTSTGEAYTLPTASASTLGGVKVGTGLSVSDDGVLSSTSTGEAYTLPTASASTLGGVKVGTGLSVSEDGTLSSTGEAYTLPTASASTLGGVKVGTGLTVSEDGTLSATASGSGSGVTEDSSGVECVHEVSTIAEMDTVANVDQEKLHAIAPIGDIAVGEDAVGTKYLLKDRAGTDYLPVDTLMPGRSYLVQYQGGGGTIPSRDIVTNTYKSDRVWIINNSTGSYYTNWGLNAERDGKTLYSTPNQIISFTDRREVNIWPNKPLNNYWPTYTVNPLDVLEDILEDFEQEGTYLGTGPSMLPPGVSGDTLKYTGGAWHKGTLSRNSSGTLSESLDMDTTWSLEFMWKQPNGTYKCKYSTGDAFAAYSTKTGKEDQVIVQLMGAYWTTLLDVTPGPLRYVSLSSVEALSLMPGIAYTLTLTCNMTLSVTITDSTLRQEAFLDINPGTYKLREGGNLTFADSLTPGKLNHCHIVWHGTSARLYVYDVEDAGSSSGGDDSGDTTTATLTVTLEGTTSGAWSVDGGTTWKSSGESVTATEGTVYEVTFKAVDGYTTPDAQSVTLVAGANALTATYTEEATTTAAFAVSGLTADSSPSGDLSVYMGDYEVDGTTTYNGTTYTRYKLAGGAYYLAHCAITSHWGFSTKAEPSTPSDCDMYGYFNSTSPTAPTAAQLQSLSWTDASGVLLSMTFK